MIQQWNLKSTVGQKSIKEKEAGFRFMDQLTENITSLIRLGTKQGLACGVLHRNYLAWKLIILPNNIQQNHHYWKSFNLKKRKKLMDLMMIS